MHKIIIVGHSHATAVGTALAVRRRSEQAQAVHFDLVHLREEKFRPDAHGATQETPLGTAASDYIEASAASSSGVLSCLHGNFHNMISLMQHPQPFDFVLAEQPDLPLTPNAEIVPYRLIQQLMRTRAYKESDLIRSIRKLVSVPVYHQESPAPIRSAEYILAHADAYFSNRSISVTGVSPPWLRYKAWRAYCLAVRETYEEAGILCLPPPAQGRNEDGFLHPNAYSNDATHANAWYGELVLRSMESVVSQGVYAT